MTIVLFFSVRIKANRQADNFSTIGLNAFFLVQWGIKMHEPFPTTTKNRKDKSCTLHRLWTLSNRKKIKQNLYYWSVSMKKFNSQFLRTQVGNLRSRQNKAIKNRHFRCKLLKSNYQKIFLKLVKLFYYFWVTL